MTGRRGNAARALVQVADTALGVAGQVRGERPRLVVHATADQLAHLTPPAASWSRSDPPPSDPSPSGPAPSGPESTGPESTGPESTGPALTRPAFTGPALTGPALTGPAFFGPAWTEAGTRLDPHTLRRIACDAVLQRVVWDRDGQALGSERLDLGRAARLADVHLRRALAARDRGCIIPGCGAPPAHCDAHHIVHWADGGPTTLANTCQLCGSHHTAVHDGTWQVRMGPDGIPEAIPPERIDPLRRPRRAPHHDADDLLRQTTRHGREPDDPDADAPDRSAPIDPSPPTGLGTPRQTSPPHPEDHGILGEPGHTPPRRARPDDDWRPPGWEPDQPYPF